MGVERVESDRQSVSRWVGPGLRPVGCRRPSATPAGPSHWSLLADYRGRIVTKAGMRGTMLHSLGNVLKQLGVSAFNRKGRLPLYGPQSIVCSPLWQKRWFSVRGHTHDHVVAQPPTPLPPTDRRLRQLNGLCGWHGLYVCVWMEGGSSRRRKHPIETHSKGGGHTHTAYHKGASGRRNVYMMSNDSPKIGLPS